MKALQSLGGQEYPILSKMEQEMLKFHKFTRDGGTRFCKQLADYIMQTDEQPNIIIFLFIPFSFLNSKNLLLAFARSVGPTSDHRQQ